MRLGRFALLVLALGLALAVSRPASAQNRFTLVNNTTETIGGLFVSPSRINNWGRDVMAGVALAPGQSFWVVPQLSDCILDIKVVYEGGREETRMQVNACNLTRVVWGTGGGGVAPTGAGDPSFQFVNRTGQTIRELYVSLTTRRDWGPDRLGRNMLAVDATFDVALPRTGVCTVDIRVVYQSGDALERRGVETCSIQSLEFR